MCYHEPRGARDLLDITVVSPVQTNLVQRCANEGGAAVEARYREKMAHYFDRCEGEGITFIPVVFDTFGGLHGAASKVITRIGRQLARGVGKPEEDTVRQLRQRLAVILVRDNMAMINSRAPTIPPAFLDGDVDCDLV